MPPEFLGLSLETPALHLPAIQAGSPQLANLLSGLGTGVLRVSGDSVDRTQWLPTPGPAAPWAMTTVTPEDLHHLAALMSSTGWRLLLGIDLGHPQPTAAAEEAGAARSILGPSLAGVAIGNEPELYTRLPAAPLRAVLGNSPLRPRGWGLAAYEAEIATMRGALAAAGVSVPMYGPEGASGDWLEPYAAAEGSSVAALTAHLYPLDRCVDEHLLKHGPSIEQLLSVAVTRSEEQRTRSLVGTAAHHGLPLRLDELGSVACAGQPGTSDTFAGALWALDAGLIAAREGVAGVNFSGGLGSCQTGGTILSPWYSPLCTLPGGQPTARPEYYALLLLHALEGCAFLPETFHTSRDIATFALRAPDGSLRVVIDDMETSAPATATSTSSATAATSISTPTPTSTSLSATEPSISTATPTSTSLSAAEPSISTATPASTSTSSPRSKPAPTPPSPVTVTLDVGPSFTRASALRLSAPSAGATQGVTLGNVALRPNGTLPRAKSSPVAGTDGRFTLQVRPASATLVTLSSAG